MKTVFIIGSTGRQGMPIAKYLANSKQYIVKGLTRNINSDISKKLRDIGIEMVQGDLNNKERLKYLFKDVDYLYSVTNTDDPEVQKYNNKEIEYGINIADAAYENNVEFVIFSSLPYIKEYDFGVYNNKNKIENYMREKEIKAVYLYMGYYMDNFINYFKPELNENDEVVFSFPIMDENCELPLIDLENDLGLIVFNILNNIKKYDQDIIYIAKEYKSIKNIVKDYSEVNNQKCIYVKNDNLYPDYITYFKIWKKDYYGKRTDLSKTHELNHNMTSWKNWIKNNNFKIIN